MAPATDQLTAPPAAPSLPPGYDPNTGTVPAASQGTAPAPTPAAAPTAAPAAPSLGEKLTSLKSQVWKSITSNTDDQNAEQAWAKHAAQTDAENAAHEKMYQDDPEAFKKQYPFEWLHRKVYDTVKNAVEAEPEKTAAPLGPKAKQNIDALVQTGLQQIGVLPPGQKAAMESMPIPLLGGGIRDYAVPPSTEVLPPEGKFVAHAPQLPEHAGEPIEVQGRVLDEKGQPAAPALPAGKLDDLGTRLPDLQTAEQADRRDPQTRLFPSGNATGVGRIANITHDVLRQHAAEAKANAPTIEPIGIHEDDLPHRAKYQDVDFSARDLQDSGKTVNEDTVRQDYANNRKDVSVYKAYVPMEDIPSSRFPVEPETEQEASDFDRGEYRDPRTGVPVKLSVTPKGEIQILDGNHRLQVWSEQDQQYAPAWVVDYRGPNIENLSEDEKAERADETEAPDLQTSELQKPTIEHRENVAAFGSGSEAPQAMSQVRLKQGDKTVGRLNYVIDPATKTASVKGIAIEDPKLQGKGYAQQMYLAAADKARAAGATSLTSDLQGTTTMEAARAWDKLQAKGHPVEKIPSKPGSPGYVMDLTKPSPLPQYGQAASEQGNLPGQKIQLGDLQAKYVGRETPEIKTPEITSAHPDLQEMADKYGVVNSPSGGPEASFITHGKFIRLPAGVAHDDAIGMLTDANGDAKYSALQGGDNRPQFINDTGATRFRLSNDKAGKTAHFSFPKQGVAPEDIPAIQQAIAAAGRDGNVVMERADVTPETKDQLTMSKEFPRPGDAAQYLRQIQAHPDQHPESDLMTNERQSPLKEPYAIEITGKDGTTRTESVDAFSSKDALKTAQKKFPDATEWASVKPGARTPSTEYSVPTGKLLSTPPVMGKSARDFYGISKEDAAAEDAAATLQTMYHELGGHGMIGLKEGMTPKGIIRHTNPDAHPNTRAAASWDASDLYVPGTRQFKPEKVDAVVKNFMGGIAADEVFSGVPRAANHNFDYTARGSDGYQAYNALRDAGYNHDDALARMHEMVDENKEYLTKPEVSGVIKENVGVREPGLSTQYHHSPERMQNMHAEIQRRIKANGANTEDINNGAAGGGGTQDHPAVVARGEGGISETAGQVPGEVAKTPAAEAAPEVNPHDLVERAQQALAAGDKKTAASLLAQARAALQSSELTTAEVKKPSVPAEKPDYEKAADQFNLAHGRPPIEKATENVDPELGKKTADLYDQMQHDPNNPKVQKAFEAMKKDVDDQWNYVTKDLGVKIEPWTKEGQPYSNSQAMRDDVNDNQHLYFSRVGEVGEHPFAEKDKAGLTYQDKFRSIHDFFGHVVGNNEFGPTGERRAYLNHRQMFSAEAQPAMTALTQGQNSWVNFGPHMRNQAGELLKPGEPGYIPLKDRPFAEQKVGLLPGKREFQPVDRDKYAQEVANSPHAASLSQVSETPGQIYQMTVDGDPQRVYYSINKDGDIAGVVNNSGGSIKGALNAIMPHAIEQGGDHLDAWSIKGTLPKLYSKYGFEITKVEPYDADAFGEPSDALKQSWRLSGWNDKEPYPSVVHMALPKAIEKMGGVDKPNYPTEDRIKDMNGEKQSDIPKFENTPKWIYDHLTDDAKAYLKDNPGLQKRMVAEVHNEPLTTDEAISVAAASSDANGWWRRFSDIMNRIGDAGKNKTTKKGVPWGDVFQAVHSSLSGNKLVEDANNLSWGVIHDWLKAGQPTDRPSLDAIVRNNGAVDPLSGKLGPTGEPKKGNAAMSDTLNKKGKVVHENLDTTELYRLMNSPEMKGEKSFGGKIWSEESPIEASGAASRKLPSMLATTAGGDLSNAVIDAIMGRFMGRVKPNLMPRTEAEYLADTVFLKRVGDALDRPTGEAQEQIWTTTQAFLKHLKDGLTPEEAADKIREEGTYSSSKDYADIILKDQEVVGKGGYLDRLKKEFGIGPGSAGVTELHKQTRLAEPPKAGESRPIDRSHLATTGQRIFAGLSEKRRAQLANKAASTEEEQTAFPFGANAPEELPPAPQPKPKKTKGAVSAMSLISSLKKAGSKPK